MALVIYTRLHQTWPIKQVLRKQIRSFEHPLISKNYKWAMEAEIELMMIRSKMNELAWKYHLPIIHLWEFF